MPPLFPSSALRYVPDVRRAEGEPVARVGLRGAVISLQQTKLSVHLSILNVFIVHHGAVVADGCRISSLLPSVMPPALRPKAPERRCSSRTFRYGYLVTT